LSWLADFFPLRDCRSLPRGGVDPDVFLALVLSLELLRDFVDFLLLDRDVSDSLLFLDLDRDDLLVFLNGDLEVERFLLLVLDVDRRLLSRDLFLLLESERDLPPLLESERDTPFLLLEPERDLPFLPLEVDRDLLPFFDLS